MVPLRAVCVSFVRYVSYMSHVINTTSLRALMPICPLHMVSAHWRIDRRQCQIRILPPRIAATVIAYFRYGADTRVRWMVRLPDGSTLYLRQVGADVPMLVELTSHLLHLRQFGLGVVQFFGNDCIFFLDAIQFILSYCYMH